MKADLQAEEGGAEISPEGWFSASQWPLGNSYQAFSTPSSTEGLTASGRWCHTSRWPGASRVIMAHPGDWGLCQDSRGPVLEGCGNVRPGSQPDSLTLRPLFQCSSMCCRERRPLSKRAVGLLPWCLRVIEVLCRPRCLGATRERPSDLESRSGAQWRTPSVEQSWEIRRAAENMKSMLLSPYILFTIPLKVTSWKGGPLKVRSRC